MLTLTPRELSSLLEKSPNTIELIDVRGADEYEEVHISEALLIPLPMLPIRMSEIDKTKQVIFICRSGARSAQACTFIEKDEVKAYNLSGGMIDFESAFPMKVVHGERKKLFRLF